MKLNKGLVTVIISVVLLNWNLKGQDATFSQFNLNQFYYNPAYTGYRGGYQIHATYRSQWPNVPGKVFPGPLSSYYGFMSASFHEKGNLGGSIGAFAMQKMEGEGYLKTSSFGLSVAQHFGINVKKIDREPRIQITAGFKAYFTTIGINWDKLVFTDQLNVDYGISATSGIGQTGTQTTKPFGDVDAGVLLWNNFRGKDKWYNEVGLSLNHILSPYISITRSTTDATRLARKVVINYRSLISMKGGKVAFGPVILFEKQSKFYELNTGVDVYLKFNPAKNVPVPLTFSILHRLAAPGYINNTNAIIAGITHNGRLERGNKRGDEYYISFAADFPYQGLGAQSKEAFEVSIGIIFRKRVSGEVKCPWGGSDHTQEMNSYYRPKFKNR